MELQPISRDVLAEKYAKGEEARTDGDAMIAAIRRRVARGLAAVEKDPAQWEEPFFRAQEAGMVPAGRIASAAGTDISATLINCFVQPVGDAVSGEENGRPGIYNALMEAAETMRRGGGVGYDFSAIRPRGSFVKGTASSASGPISYMFVFDKSCQTVESAGARRGAQMGVLRVDHPDIEEFVDVKQTPGQLNNFNISVGVTDTFMEALAERRPFQLVHRAAPNHTAYPDAFQREDGMWVYREIDPHGLWDRIMRNTYNAAEPGVLFIDQMNRENNLYYCEVIEATNPCGEQPLPAYGCCCLSSINLTGFIREPFTDYANFDFAAFAELVAVSVRMLDNVLDVTYWPLPQQQQEAQNKRRVGLGFTGLGDALVMLGLRYDSAEARQIAAQVSEAMRDAAYRASVELAQEKGAFPLFDADKYLAGRFVQRLPEDIRKAIRKHGIRNSHLLSIAPTGTISLAFADNASNGIEPAFSWWYYRNKRTADGRLEQYQVEDHAYRLYRQAGGNLEQLPPAFINALEISALDHMRMLEAVQPYVDTSISKTVNVPADYNYEDFKDLYLEAWRAGLKGLATFRPNDVIGSVLTTEKAGRDYDTSEPDRKLRLDRAPQPALASLRWPGRPRIPGGNPAVTYMVNCPGHPFAAFVGHMENGAAAPFEVWTNGAEQPRGLAALGKTLSMDMRSFDRRWLKLKLEALASVQGRPFELAMPPSGEAVAVPSVAAALARLVEYRCRELGSFDEEGPSPMIDAMFALKEPKSGTEGTLSWTVDIKNPATGDDFALFLKELVMPDGSHRPYSVWISGTYPEVFAALCKSLSLDMRIIDPAWIGKKLRSLADFPEPQGDFLARVPGSDKQATQPSTVAYMARLIIHRFNMLGILDADGYPLDEMGILQQGHGTVAAETPLGLQLGKQCPECHNQAVIKKDGCDFCTACGYIGACG